MVRPSIVDYKNYRVFLNDFYLFKKGQPSGYSYAKFARDAGILAPNILKLVIDGVKNLTTSTLLKFARALELTFVETNFFEALVLLNQASEPLEVSYYEQRWNQLRSTYAKVPRKISSNFGLFDHPLLPAALNGLLQSEPGDEIRYLTQEVGLPVGVAEHLTAVLKNRGIVMEQNGKFQPNEEHYIFTEKTSNVRLKTYLQDQLELSMAAFATSYDDHAKFYSHTLSVDPSRWDELQSETKEFMMKMNTKFDSAPGGKVCQLNLQCFLIQPRVLRKYPSSAKVRLKYP